MTCYVAHYYYLVLTETARVTPRPPPVPAVADGRRVDDVLGPTSLTTRTRGDRTRRAPRLVQRVETPVHPQTGPRPVRPQGGGCRPIVCLSHLLSNDERLGRKNRQPLPRLAPGGTGLGEPARAARQGRRRAGEEIVRPSPHEKRPLRVFRHVFRCINFADETSGGGLPARRSSWGPWRTPPITRGTPHNFNSAILDP